MTLTGRRRFLPDIKCSNTQKRAYAERQVPAACVVVGDVLWRVVVALVTLNAVLVDTALTRCECGQAVNTVIQGTAADVIKLAMIHTRRRFQGPAEHTGGAASQRVLQAEDQCRLLLQIHDELLFECLDAPEPIRR